MIPSDISNTFFLKRDSSKHYETKVERNTRLIVAPYLEKLQILLDVGFKFVRAQDVSKVILTE